MVYCHMHSFKILLFLRNIMDVSILSLKFDRNCFNIKLNTLSTGALDAGTLTTLNAGLSRTVLLHSKRPNNQFHQSQLIFSQVVTCDDKVLGFTEDRVQ